MKKTFLLALISFLIIKSHAQCVPNPDWNENGLNPSKLPNGIVGTDYSTILTFKSPKDSTIVYSGQTYNAIIDSARVDLVKNFPKGFTWACNKPTCTWKGGEKGCSLLTGKPDSTHFKKYEIKLFVRSWITVVGLSFQLERLDSSIVDYYIDGGINSVQNVSNKVDFKVFPNPAKNTLQIEVSNLNGEEMETRITDITGKTVYNKNISVSSTTIDVSDMPKGMYFISFKNKVSNYTQKLIIE